MPTSLIPVADVMAGPSCSNSHIPGFINHKKLKSAGDVFVIAVNDPFVLVLSMQFVQWLLTCSKHKSMG